MNKNELQSYEDFKNKNFEYYKKIYESAKKEFRQNDLFLNEEVLTLEKSIQEGYKAEYFYFENFKNAK
jgi:hypothetical protein